GCPWAGSQEIISIPGSGPNLRAVDWNWRVTRENPGSPVVGGVPPPAGDARRAQGRPRPAGQGFFATPPTRPGVKGEPTSRLATVGRGARRPSTSIGTRR